MEQKAHSKVSAQSPAEKASGSLTSAQWKNFLVALVLLTACFSLPIYRLARFAWGNELYSYILLVPVITWYLARQKTPEVKRDSKPLPGLGAGLAALGVIVVGCYFMLRAKGVTLQTEDGLALFALAYVFFFFGMVIGILGRDIVKELAFPFGMMIFFIPMPVFLRNGIELFLQYGTAYATQGIFKLSGLPFYRNGLVFILPGLPGGISVEPECSGIHSTLILFITSLLAGYLFLRSPFKRAILTAAVLPLGLIRNGFRVFTIGQLCVHYGPQMIDSPIHRKGGPLFFALSLIPFFTLLIFLYHRERRSAKTVKN
jgi:exosortase C (VPDSG-CTERM-specific)